MSQPYLALITPLSRGGERPDHELPGGGYPSPPIYHPGHPDHGLPSGGHPWLPGHLGGGNRPDNSLPGSGGPVDPGFGRPGGGAGGPPSWGGGWGSGNRPSNELPDAPQPKSSLYAAAPESAIPAKPDAPNPDLGEWVLVALGDRAFGWAWLDKTQAQPK